MKKAIIKHITKPRKYNYHFWRFLVSAFYKRNTNVIAGVFSWLYRQKSESFIFTDIFVIENAVFIYTTRPGIWIGKGGQTIDDLAHYLNYDIKGNKIHNYSINLIEDNESAFYEKEVVYRVISDFC